MAREIQIRVNTSQALLQPRPPSTLSLFRLSAVSTELMQSPCPHSIPPLLGKGEAGRKDILCLSDVRKSPMQSLTSLKLSMALLPFLLAEEPLLARGK